MTHHTRPAVFLDRDDTLIRCSDVAPDGDLGDPTRVQLLPGALLALQLLHHAGFRLFLITNQGGVARGKYAEHDVRAVHRRIRQLTKHLIHDDRYCPYHPNGTLPKYTREHHWRKPAPGMILDLAQHHPIDLARSWTVGDKPRDAAAGRAAGTRTILLGPPHSPPHSTAEPTPDFVAPDLLAAARLILEHADPTRS